MVVVREPWRADPLAWIHRVEARGIARELGARLVSGDIPAGAVLRLSDPKMREAVRVLKVPYCGPGSAALERCYDKYEAHRIVTGAGCDAPATVLASEARPPPAPFVLKPRRGSDSIGVRVVKDVPKGNQNHNYLAQERIVGAEVTVALFRDQVGMPLRILLPPGTPYSFWRKYLVRTRRAPLDDMRLRVTALKIGDLLGVDWAARVDFIVEPGGRACFLECDAAPMVGADSAFAASFAAAGVGRARQLDWLTSSRPAEPSS